MSGLLDHFSKNVHWVPLSRFYREWPSVGISWWWVGNKCLMEINLVSKQLSNERPLNVILYIIVYTYYISEIPGCHRHIWKTDSKGHTFRDPSAHFCRLHMKDVWLYHDDVYITTIRLDPRVPYANAILVYKKSIHFLNTQLLLYQTLKTCYNLSSSLSVFICQWQHKMQLTMAQTLHLCVSL